MSININEINAGGVNGTGKGVVNTNSKDFRGLRQIVAEHAQKQSPAEKMKYELISIRFQMDKRKKKN